MPVILDLTCMQQFARTVSLSYRCFIAEDDKKKNQWLKLHIDTFSPNRSRDYKNKINKPH